MSSFTFQTQHTTPQHRPVLSRRNCSGHASLIASQPGDAGESRGGGAGASAQPGADGHQAPQGLLGGQAAESWADFLHGSHKYLESGGEGVVTESRPVFICFFCMTLLTYYGKNCRSYQQDWRTHQYS